MVRDGDTFVQRRRCTLHDGHDRMSVATPIVSPSIGERGAQLVRDAQALKHAKIVTRGDIVFG